MTTTRSDFIRAFDRHQLRVSDVPPEASAAAAAANSNGDEVIDLDEAQVLYDRIEPHDPDGAVRAKLLGLLQRQPLAPITGVLTKPAIDGIALSPEQAATVQEAARSAQQHLTEHGFAMFEDQNGVLTETVFGRVRAGAGDHFSMPLDSMQKEAKKLSKKLSKKHGRAVSLVPAGAAHVHPVGLAPGSTPQRVTGVQNPESFPSQGDLNAHASRAQRAGRTWTSLIIASPAADPEEIGRPPPWSVQDVTSAIPDVPVAGRRGGESFEVELFAIQSGRISTPTIPAGITSQADAMPKVQDALDNVGARAALYSGTLQTGATPTALLERYQKNP